MKTKHTPGPWQYRKTDRKIVKMYLQPGYADYIAEVAGAKTSEADGRLIAAAPALLKSIKLWLAFMDSLPEGWLAHTTADIGLLNDAYLKSHAVLKEIGEK